MADICSFSSNVADVSGDNSINRDKENTVWKYVFHYEFIKCLNFNQLASTKTNE